MSVGIPFPALHLFSCPEQLYTRLCQSFCTNTCIVEIVALADIWWPCWPWTDLGWTLLILEWPFWPQTDLADLWLTFPCWPWSDLVVFELTFVLTLLTFDCFDDLAILVTLVTLRQFAIMGCFIDRIRDQPDSLILLVGASRSYTSSCLSVCLSVSDIQTAQLSNRLIC